MVRVQEPSTERHTEHEDPGGRRRASMPEQVDRGDPTDDDREGHRHTPCQGSVLRDQPKEQRVGAENYTTALKRTAASSFAP